MKLNDIVLLENQGERKRVLDFKSAVQIAKRDYNKCLEYSDPILWRGSDSYTNLTNGLLIDPMVGERKSLDSGFGYTELISNLPSWNDYPKRNKALIMSGSKKRAAVFGAPHPILLPNNFRAVVSEKDFWSSFPLIKETLGFAGISRFDKAIAILFNKPRSYEEFLNVSIPEFLVKFNSTATSEKQISKTLSSISDTGGRLLSDLYDKFDQLDSQKLLNYFNEILDPRKNNINVSADLDIIAKSRPDEVWTNNTCMVVPEEMYDPLRKSVLERN